MKSLLALILFLSTQAHAGSFPVYGAKADELVNALTQLGLDPVGTHEYFQSGVTACAKVFDESGTYFPEGAVGDYLGEECMIYGDAEGSDPDGVLRARVYIPATDRELKNNPEIRQQMERLKAVRVALEQIVVPLVRKVNVNGKEIVVAQTAGVNGIACEGRDARGQRQCRVLPSRHCPPREL